MPFADQAKAALDAVVSGPASESIRYVRKATGERLTFRMLFDNDNDGALLGGQSDYAANGVHAFASKTSLSSAKRGDRVLRFPNTAEQCSLVVERVVHEHVGGWELYLV